MKPCHENNGAAIYVGRPRPCTIICFNVYTTVEYLNRNVSIGLCCPNTFENLLWFVHGQGQNC